jgi:hypothetical protein
MIRNKSICFVCGWSIYPKKKNDGNLASCATRNDTASRHFFFRMDTSIHKQKNKFITFLKDFPPLKQM